MRGVYAADGNTKTMSMSSSCCAAVNCSTMRKTAVAGIVAAVAAAEGLDRADIGAAAQPIAAYRWDSCFYWRLLCCD